MGIMKVVNAAYVFDCPWHGRESGVFCFRAFERENRSRWKKLQIDGKEIALPDKELNALLKAMSRCSDDWL